MLTQVLLTLMVAQAPAADADVATPEAIVAAFLSAGSGPAGPRDAPRMRSLFAPDARVTTVRRDGESATPNFRTVEDYIVASRTYWRDHATYERLVRAWTERYANFAHVLAAFEARERDDTATTPPTYRAVGSFQLLWDGKRWWITSAYWQGERPGELLPDKFRGGA